MSPSVWQEEMRNDYCVCGFHMEPGKKIKNEVSFFLKAKWKETIYEQQNEWLSFIFGLVFFVCFTTELH